MILNFSFLGYTPFFIVLNALALILCLLARRVQWVVHGRFLLVDIDMILNGASLF